MTYLYDIYLPAILLDTASRRASDKHTGGANNSVRVPKRPIAPMAPAGRLAVSECFVGVYMTDYDYCELPTLN